MTLKNCNNKIRVGIFGLNRGYYNIKNIIANGGEIAAFCDKDERLMRDAMPAVGCDVPCFSDFDKFIETPMDCVFLANYFHEHTEYAIKCLEKGIHVLSECTSNSTMADGVRLVRAAQQSSARYFLAENYPYMNFCCEMKRVFEGGSLGRLMFAEGEYNHPGSSYYDMSNPVGLKYTLSLCDSDKHWRNYLPATYYITHSLAPLMLMTGAVPKKVNAFAIFMPRPEDSDVSSRNGDKTAVIMTQNDDGSVFRVTGCAAFGGGGDSYRICGTNGQIENVRGEKGKVMLRYNDWEIPEGAKEKECYLPSVYTNDKDLQYIQNAGHAGSDFIIIREIFDSIRTGKPFPMDVYFATAMASVAILGHRSVLSGGMPFDIPDFRYESDRIKWENDRQSPFYYSDGTEPNIPCCSHPEYRPSARQIENSVLWRKRYDDGEFDEVEKLKG